MRKLKLGSLTNVNKVAEQMVTGSGPESKTSSFLHPHVLHYPLLGPNLANKNSDVENYL